VKACQNAVFDDNNTGDEMKTLAKWAAIWVLLAGAWTPAAAQDYPAKTITFIVPYAAGGNGDIRGRQVAQKLASILGKPVVVENKAGAGGNIGTDAVAKAAPDGYTIGMGNFAPMSVNASMFKNMPFDPKKDVLPVALIERGPLVLMVNPKSAYKSVKDIVDAAKAKPGVLTAANGGIGGSHHLSAELFKQTAGVDIISVAYKGGSPATTDLMAGNVDMMFEQMYAAAPSIQSGKLRPLATTGSKRLPQFPDLPTFAELGYPKIEVLNWQGVIAPKGTPVAIIAKLNDAVNRALKEPDMREKITSQGNEVGGGTPQEFAALISSESEKWGRVVREAKIKPE
jgi:tripartite-type tricarboxylate transporter receptor subunit TctC